MNGRHITASELDKRLGRMDTLIGRLADQVAAHETWHRDMLTRAAEQGTSRRIAVWALIFSAAAAAAAVLTAAASLLG